MPRATAFAFDPAAEPMIVPSAKASRTTSSWERSSTDVSMEGRKV
jgi:hypothetical protein